VCCRSAGGGSGVSDIFPGTVTERRWVPTTPDRASPSVALEGVVAAGTLARRKAQDALWLREPFGCSRPGKRALTPSAEGLAGNEEVEMVAVLTLLAVAAILAAEITWIVRA
jgi:hypothetical protein